MEHPWLALVSLALHWLPLGSPVVNNWEHWNTTGTTGIPLETTLLNVLMEDDLQLVTTGIPLGRHLPFRPSGHQCKPSGSQ
jgi:hypothetical protein